MSTEHFPHHADQLQGTFVVHAIIYAIGVLARDQDVLLTLDAQMLCDFALRRAHLVHDVLLTHLVISELAQNFQSYWMRHGLERSRRKLDVFVVGHQRVIEVIHDISSSRQKLTTHDNLRRYTPSLMLS